MGVRFSTRYLLLVAISILALASLLFVATASASTPTIESESVSGVTSTNAILEAQISPHNGSFPDFGAHDQFQLVTDPDEYASEILCPEPPRGFALCLGEYAEGTWPVYAEGALPVEFIYEEPTSVSLDLSSEGVTLQPGTTYHYRVLAASAIRTEDTIEWKRPIIFGEDRTFTTPSGPALGPALTLTLNIEEGSGTVASNPAGLVCTGTAPHKCTTESIAEGTVTLTASPVPGYRFKSWKGCDKKEGEFGVNGRQCTISLNKAKEVGAKFVKTYDLTLENGGGGRVYSKPEGALCLPNCTEAVAEFDEGKTVEVLAQPSRHFHFVSWGGGCSGGGPCKFESIAADHTVSATFAEDTKYALSLAKAGGGQGLLKSTPAGIDCGYTCPQAKALFYKGEAITLSWKLNKGTTSIDWGTGSGTCAGESKSLEGSCTVEMDEAHSLLASFE